MLYRIATVHIIRIYVHSCLYHYRYGRDRWKTTSEKDETIEVAPEAEEVAEMCGGDASGEFGGAFEPEAPVNCAWEETPNVSATSGC